MHFIELNSDIIFTVLGVWCNLVDLTKLDSAMCSLRLRTYFLELIANKLFVFKSVVNHQNESFLWIDKRMVKLESIELSRNLMSDMIFNTSKIKSIFINHPQYKECRPDFSILKLINSCHNLQEISIPQDSLCPLSLFTEINHDILNRLTSISHHADVHSITETTIQHLANHCSQLRTCIVSGYKLSQNDEGDLNAAWLQLLANNKLLAAICLCGDTNSIVQAIISRYFQHISLDFIHSGENPLKHFQTILERIPEVKVIQLRYGGKPCTVSFRSSTDRSRNHVPHEGQNVLCLSRLFSTNQFAVARHITFLRKIQHLALYLDHTPMRIRCILSAIPTTSYCFTTTIIWKY